MRSSHPQTQQAVTRQLSSALRRGYWRVAIRRFLMLRAYGFEVPEALQHEVAMLMAHCPSADLRQIKWQVSAWRNLKSGRHDCDGR